MSDDPLHVDPTLPERGRWFIVGGLSLLALPVVFSFFFFGMVAADGCVGDCTTRSPQPVLAWALAAGAGTMGGGWAGLVPWAMGRPRLIARTFLAGLGLVLAMFAVVTLLA